jgi:hypothetical protein
VRWWGSLAALAAVRVAIPLVAWARDTPGLPHVDRDPRDGGLTGDATGFYAATREFMAAWGRMPRPLFALLALAALAGAAALVVVWRRRPELRAWLVPAAVCAAGLVVCVDVAYMEPSGAAVFGWPLVWAVALLPFRAAGALTTAVAWDVALVLQLAFVALTVVAVAYVGRNASGRRWVGLVAAAFWTAWPLIVGVVAGHDAWSNGQWEVDAGLHAYSEPLSTLLVATAAAFLLSPELTPLRASLAGCALGLATLTKLSNALLAAAALVLVRGNRYFLAGAVSLAPLVAVYWPLSYPKLFDNRNSWPADPFDPAHVVSSWTESSLFSPWTLLVLLPLAVLGAFRIRRPLVYAFLLINPIFYSFYANTAQHPRFLYASLPFLFTLWAGGVAVLARR